MGKQRELHEASRFALNGKVKWEIAKKNKKVVAFSCGCGIISEPQVS